MTVLGAFRVITAADVDLAPEISFYGSRSAAKRDVANRNEAVVHQTAAAAPAEGGMEGG